MLLQHPTRHALCPSRRTLVLISSPRNNISRHQRTFVTPSWPTELPTQTLTASRTLSYPAPLLYDIIADVNSYSTFLPYCTSSRVTRWSEPDTSHPSQRRWPYQATLKVGWSSFEETVISRVYCQPYNIVEAVIGEAEKTIPDGDIPHYNHHALSDLKNQERGNTPLKYLFTRWSLKPFPYKPPSREENPLYGKAEAPPIERTDVSLELRFQFQNPVYAAMSQAVAGKVAGNMVEAFAKRAREVLGEPGNEKVQQGGKSMEGDSAKGLQKGEETEASRQIGTTTTEGVIDK
ncbi:MAG: hypothetical protein M1823_003562 [Watsoniomyces obsoletus]|nr:MAG: hypothetical protein M1823_003562 [Watsoniomyces obsoletus]